VAEKSDLAPGKDGRIVFPDGTVLTHVAVAPDQPLKAADQGLQLYFWENCRKKGQGIMPWSR